MNSSWERPRWIFSVLLVAFTVTLSASVAFPQSSLPMITSQPQPQTVSVGQTATFSVSASGPGPLSYQWQVNNNNIPGANSASYTTPATTLAYNGALYRVVVINAFGNQVSNTALLTVNEAPVIVTQPASQTVLAPQTATFSVKASGTAPLTYQWKKNGMDILGANASSFTTGATSANDDGSTYQVIVTNPVNATPSNLATLTVHQLPGIVTQPVNQMVSTGQMATFFVVASGTAPLSYQWQINGNNIPGANSASYTTPAITFAFNGASYRVVVHNAFGTAISNSASVMVNSVPVIVTQPKSVTVALGQTATFSVVASGPGPLFYQWQANNSNIPNATSTSFTTDPTTLGFNGTTYRVTVTNSVGTTFSNSATLTVTQAPTILTQPTSETVQSGQTATFAVTGTSTSPLTYQWQANNANIPGATASLYTTAATNQYFNGAVFKVYLHNMLGTAVSNPATLTVTAAPPFNGVLTYHNDGQRTGQNQNETKLTPANVNTSTFGKKFSVAVDGQIYAQPLYAKKSAITGSTHNIVYVATENGSVYAFDADVAGAPLWHTSLLLAGETAIPAADVSPCTQITPNIGVTSTPVIDLSSQTLYVETASKNTGSGAHFQRLHALDLLTGAEKFGGPATISGSVPGTGAGSDGTNVAFDPLLQLNRPALALANGVVYVGFGSHCDQGNYHGWVFAYDAASLARLSIFNTTPNGSQGGVWESGGGFAVDPSGDIFVVSGNGTFDANSGGVDYGDSVIRLTLQGGTTFAVVDSFTPFNQSTLASADNDFGSGGVVSLFDGLGTADRPHLMTMAGKEGRIYLLDRTNLGTYCNGCPSDSQIVQSLPSALGPNFSTPAYWQNKVYYVSQDNPAMAFSLVYAQLSASPISQSSFSFGFPGATPSVSANGGTNGILWMIDTSAAGTGPAVLFAFDASNLATLLYFSNQAAGNRDVAGTAVKFAVPTVANGGVYVGADGELDVYSLLP